MKGIWYFHCVTKYIIQFKRLECLVNRWEEALEKRASIPGKVNFGYFGWSCGGGNIAFLPNNISATSISFQVDHGTARDIPINDWKRFSMFTVCFVLCLAPF